MLNKALLLLVAGSKDAGKDNFDITFTSSGGIRPTNTWNVEDHVGEVPYFKNKDNFLKNISSDMYGDSISSNAPVRVESSTDAIQILFNAGASGKFDIAKGSTLIDSVSDNPMGLSGTDNVKFTPPPTGWLKQCKVTIASLSMTNIATPNKTIYGGGTADIEPFYIPEGATIYANASRGSVYAEAMPSSNVEISHETGKRVAIKVLGDCALKIYAN